MDEKEIEAARHDLNDVAPDGEIGCMVNGAGLAHLAFARPGAGVLELMQLGRKPSARMAMAHISRRRAHRHLPWLAPTEPAGKRWRVDLPALLPEVVRLCREAGG